MFPTLCAASIEDEDKDNAKDYNHTLYAMR